MSEVDLENQVSSGEEGAGGLPRLADGTAGERLVPVGEAIRYRKRARSAEQEAAALEQRLEASQARNKKLEDELDEARLQSRLVSGLTTAGVNDLEAAVLLARARMKETGGDADSVIEQLRKEKSYLFEDAAPSVVAAKTAGVKERKPGGQSALERAAKRAASSPSRADMQEYMRVRRQYV